MIVDDNELVVIGLEKLFLENAFEVETAKDGFEAGFKTKEFSRVQFNNLDFDRITIKQQLLVNFSKHNYLILL